MKSPDEVRRELTEQWLAKANEDLRLVLASKLIGESTVGSRHLEREGADVPIRPPGYPQVTIASCNR